MQTLAFHLGYSSLDKDYYGSEISLMYLANELKTNYKIYVFSLTCKKERIIDGIEYLNWDKFKDYDFDILIISRYLSVFLHCVIKAKKVFLWLHDIIPAPYYLDIRFHDDGFALLSNVIDKIDKIIVLTKYHYQVIKETYRLDDSKLEIICNGLCVSKFKETEKEKYRFIYTSCAKRGLNRLLKMFPKIRDEFPQAELYVYRIKEYEGCDLPYVHFEGDRPNDEIIESFAKSSVWLYPTHFVETCCNSAMEAQMSGCLCITTKLGGLEDTVADRGVLLEGIIDSEEYTEKILKSLRVFYNTDMYNNKIKKAKEWAKEKDWKCIAEQFLKLF